MGNNSSNRFFYVAGWSAYASGIVSAIGIVLLLLSWTVHGPFGKLNDNAVIGQYLLALPITLALQQVMQARTPALSNVTMLTGIIGIVAIVILQFLLVIGALSFAQEIGPLLMGLLIFGVWLGITGYQLGQSIGEVPRGLLMGILAALYFGYPVWAFWLARLLLSGKLTISRLSTEEETA